MTNTFVNADDIRARFSAAMSEMYRAEVPQYSELLALVADVNRRTSEANPDRRDAAAEESARLAVERHGAIRVGTPQELATLRRIFAVMGMQPVGYYDLSVAGVPVHSTAFRPTEFSALQKNPFRVFTSLLRLELIDDASLREEARRILADRNIFTARALALVDRFESQGGLTEAEASEFVSEVLETFRWHSHATVSADTYKKLHDAHRLIADVVCFKSTHINHLTPRTLDIDAAQQDMLRRGLQAKDVIEGPPTRKHPILLRQTSFKALEESVHFLNETSAGTHTARFGEIEQRGMALTKKGRALYDELLAKTRASQAGGTQAGGNYADRLAAAFEAFPDDLPTIHAQGLAYFQYRIADEAALARERAWDLDGWVQKGIVEATPITYEDFLPVSAAGIFQSNLGGTTQKTYSASSSKASFEADLQCEVLDELSLYQSTQDASVSRLRERFTAAN
ncbi:2-oxoadipate dioxygenase/decarboxylase HglS [Cupriavidus plantarum]|uniref:2-oxoadipate dioxygenase/decarboxylase HglS n=1 Tax=Cupriavidus plantarum TaxID=942865 RepID=UPI001AFE469A|nr:VOC family protein [Cupriavidus plantarum]CAG2136425.1 hypothetical protein LMG26296_02363 [Cupriavidus plantarum]SMR84742.1 Uncharacterized metalloenzyme YdcJ, glyoxalase superfamily [Cupriavidus plantarum]